MSELSELKLRVNEVRNGADTALPDNLLGVTASAWCSWNGTGTPAILESHNVSSITDRGTGEFTVNFTASLTTTTYCVTTGLYDTNTASITQMEVETQATGSVEVGTRFTSGAAGAAFDSLFNYVAIFGGQ